MVLLLRGLIWPLEDQTSVSNTHTEQLTTASHSGSRESNALFWLLTTQI